MKNHRFYFVMGALLLAGCGTDSNDPVSLVNGISDTGYYDVTVERGPLLGAYVMDGKGRRANEIGNGVYRFADSPNFPVSVAGGIIDLDRDGSVSEGDVENPVVLKTARGRVATLVSTLAMDESVRTWLKEQFGITDEIIDNSTPSLNRTVAAISDEIYVYCQEQGIDDPASLDLDLLRTSLQDRIAARIQSYLGDERSIADLERELMRGLGVSTLTAEDVAARLSGNGSDVMMAVVEALPAADLTKEQKYTLAYMWNEEKLAKDIYLALNEMTPSNTLYNIATRAETQHQEWVEALLQKYDLNILDLSDYSGGYSAETLSQYGRGEFSVSELQTLYDELYAKGSQSLQRALEVGCMVEVTDVEDLDRDIETAEGVLDLVLVYSSLRSGSYNHYWAFDRALKNQGVEAGCCSLGERYCKTESEYPASNGGKRGNGPAGGH